MDDGLARLTEVSARIGGDPLLVQGPGGNTSVKAGDVLWVKGSGSWLSDAASRPIFLPLSLSGARSRLAGDLDADLSDLALQPGEGGMRPSIETAFHALMPHAAVIHAHAVNAMATAVLADGEFHARVRLDGKVRWAWVGYHRPGAPLAAAIGKVLADQAPDVLILQNHGIIVGAATPDDAEALLREVEDLLALPVRDLPAAGPLDAMGDYEPLPGLSGLALDAGTCAGLSAAPLFPDQVVFVGGAVPTTGPGETIADAARRVHGATGVMPALVLAPGEGAYGLRGRTRAADAVMRGLFEVARRLPAGAAVIGLPPDAAPALLAWDAEKHRIGLAAGKTV